LELGDGDLGVLDFPDGVTYCICSVEGGTGVGVRYWSDGTLPTATAGHYFGDGGLFDVFNRDNISRINIIGVGGDATIMVSYYK
jgi:hypothetical protein